jgi:hypothetical protein
MSDILKLSRKVVLRDKMNEAIEEYKKAELEYALEICPFSIGEEITILGYSHNGKKGIVSNIYGANGTSYNGHWKLNGRVLKKDGTLGVNFFDFDENAYHGSLKKKVTK